MAASQSTDILSSLRRLSMGSVSSELMSVSVMSKSGGGGGGTVVGSKTKKTRSSKDSAAPSNKQSSSNANDRVIKGSVLQVGRRPWSSSTMTDPMWSLFARSLFHLVKQRKNIYCVAITRAFATWKAFLRLNIFPELDPVAPDSEEDRQRKTFLSLYAENERMGDVIQTGVRELALREQLVRDSGARSIVVMHLRTRLRCALLHNNTQLHNYTYITYLALNVGRED